MQNIFVMVKFVPHVPDLFPVYNLTFMCILTISFKTKEKREQSLSGLVGTILSSLIHTNILSFRKGKGPRKDYLRKNLDIFQIY